jgi:hypothetical protein
MMNANPRIFISYRRQDSSGSAGRLYDRLAQDIPAENLFIDVDAIAPGVDFVEEIARRVQACDVLLAVIGRGWHNAADKDGRRRIDDPADFVRIEIASALRGDIRVIPVLVDGAAMPLAEHLPEDLQALVRRNAVELSHHRFAADVGRLVRALGRAPGAVQPIEHQAVPVRAAPAAQAPPTNADVSYLRLGGVALTLLAIIGSSVLLAMMTARAGPEWWFERTSTAGKTWSAIAVLVAPAIAARLWLPRLLMAQLWGIVGATIAGLVAMIALQLGLTLVLPPYVTPQPQSTADDLLWMGFVEIPVTAGGGLVLGYFLAQTLRGWFPGNGGRGFTRRMITIWMLTGVAYAVATFLLVAIGEALAQHDGGAAQTQAARLDMRMWADTVLYALAWSMGWTLTVKLAGRGARV